MGLNKESEQAKFVNIKKGKLVIKERDKEPEIFKSITGTITGVDFKIEDYEGKKYERATIKLIDKGERYLLQMRTDSGYFRGFCNALKTGDHTAEMEIQPNMKQEPNKNPVTTCFITQFGKPLKWYSTKDHPMDVPPLVEGRYKGETVWDNTNQLAYWKAWLGALQFNHSVMSGPATEFIPNASESTTSAEEHVDDLPF